MERVVHPDPAAAEPRESPGGAEADFFLEGGLRLRENPPQDRRGGAHRVLRHAAAHSRDGAGLHAAAAGPARPGGRLVLCADVAGADGPRRDCGARLRVRALEVLRGPQDEQKRNGGRTEGNGGGPGVRREAPGEGQGAGRAAAHGPRRHEVGRGCYKPDALRHCPPLRPRRGAGPAGAVEGRAQARTPD